MVLNPESRLAWVRKWSGLQRGEFRASQYLSESPSFSSCFQDQPLRRVWGYPRFNYDLHVGIPLLELLVDLNTLTERHQGILVVLFDY